MNPNPSKMPQDDLPPVETLPGAETMLQCAAMSGNGQNLVGPDPAGPPSSPSTATPPNFTAGPSASPEVRKLVAALNWFARISGKVQRLSAEMAQAQAGARKPAGAFGKLRRGFREARLRGRAAGLHATHMTALNGVAEAFVASQRAKDSASVRWIGKMLLELPADSVPPGFATRLHQACPHLIGGSNNG